jgi:hypothetical protein
MGFGASLAPPPPKEGKGFVPFFTPNENRPTDPLELVEPADLIQFGCAPFP